jgi:hypothetical protein
MWSLATLASIGGLLLGVMAIVTTGAMAVPIFTGQRTRDAVMLSFICVPLLQIALVVVGTMREEMRPETAIKLYALAVLLLIVLLALPALASLAR